MKEVFKFVLKVVTILFVAFSLGSMFAPFVNDAPEEFIYGFFREDIAEILMRLWRLFLASVETVILAMIFARVVKDEIKKIKW